MLIWLLALVLTAVLVEAACRFAPAIGLVDIPTDRKAHQGDIPLVGGIAIFLGLVLTMSVFGVLQDHWAFLAGALILVSVGIWDDVRGISPALRLVFQGGAVLLVAFFGGAILMDLGAILPGDQSFQLDWMAIPITVFAGIGLINAFNMSDGVDGLCGTLALVALTGLGIVAALGEKQNELVLIVLLGGALVGFLVFNMRIPGRAQAKAFLGDAGSYLLGLSVLYLTIRLSQGAERAMTPVSGLWFCMLPLFDTIGMILRRMKRGHSPFTPDREHIHHVFLLAKFTVTETWAGLTVVAVLGMLLGVFGLLTGVSELAMVVAFAGALLVYYWTIKRAWKVMRFLSRSINRRTQAKRDRRCGTERRLNFDGYYINGMSVERRTGFDRRDQSDDRRRDEEIAAKTAALVAQPGSVVRSDNPSARAN